MMSKSCFTKFVLVCVAVFMLSVSCMGAVSRSYAGGQYFLGLDGISSFVPSVTGGAISAEIAYYTNDPYSFTRKIISQVKFEDFEIQVGFSRGLPIHQWISDTFLPPNPNGSNDLFRTGSVGFADFTLQQLWRKEFYNSLITEVTIPACDASAKTPSYLKVKISPEVTRRILPPSGMLPTGVQSRQQAWLPNNFRLTIDKLDCSKVNRIESFTVKRPVISYNSGESRDITRLPGLPEFPNLEITLTQASSDAWTKWHEDFVVNGNSAAQNEREGVLSLLTQDGKTELARILLHGLGIIQVEPVPIANGNESAPRVTALLYCQSMEFVLPAVQTP